MSWITKDGHDVSKLPQWAQHQLKLRNAAIADLRWRLGEACMASCPYCRAGLPVKEIPSGMFPGRTEFAHIDPEIEWMPKCQANSIRQVMIGMPESLE